MRDFPVFTTQYGVASLVLKEVPYRGIAYIKLLDSLEPEKLLEECTDFCKAVGAQRIYATGNPCLDRFPLHATIVMMESSAMPETDAVCVAVTEHNLEQWLRIYNEKMASVPNAAFLDGKDAQKILVEGSGSFVYRDAQLLGIAKGAGNTIEAVASVSPGAGKDLVAAAWKQLNCESVRLQVAWENTRAVRLYQRLGFVKTEEISRWFEIF